MSKKPTLEERTVFALERLAGAYERTAYALEVLICKPSSVINEDCACPSGNVCASPVCPRSHR